METTFWCKRLETLHESCKQVDCITQRALNAEVVALNMTLGRGGSCGTMCGIAVLWYAMVWQAQSLRSILLLMGYSSYSKQIGKGEAKAVHDKIGKPKSQVQSASQQLYKNSHDQVEHAHSDQHGDENVANLDASCSLHARQSSITLATMWGLQKADTVKSETGACAIPML